MLKVRNLTVNYQQNSDWFSNRTLSAVRNVSFDILTGEIVGIVGESGSGKSTLARSLLRLQKAHSGQIDFHDQSILEINNQQMRKLRRFIQMVFQDPLSSLNPRLQIGRVISEPLQQFYPNLSYQQRFQKTQDIIQQVELSNNVIGRYPHQLSGGQCQRVSIARALICKPELVVCDEAVSALDVSVQAQILNLLRGLTTGASLSLLFISHDLRVIRQLCDRVLVMYQGQIVESANCEDLFERPKHDYTKRLLSSIPETFTIT